jgi:hypothetical protein
VVTNPQPLNQVLTTLAGINIRVSARYRPAFQGSAVCENSSRKFRTLARRRLPRREAVVSFLTEGITPQQLEMLASLMDEKKCGTVEIY